MKKVKIKICGLKTVREAAWVREAGTEFAGIVLFFPKSRRNVSIQQAASILQELGNEINKVAVVVSPTIEQIQALEQLPFDYIQIHGVLTEEVVKNMKLPYFRAVNEIENGNTLPDLKCAGYVYDAKEPGSGEVFDWNLLQDIPRDEKLFILAGGLCAENVVQAIRQVSPDVVDVSSGVERADGEGKDHKKIQTFVQLVRNETKSSF